MLNTTLNAPQFIVKRKGNIENVAKVLNARKEKYEEAGRRLKKRTIGKLYYRTKSFKAYKIPRKRRRSAAEVAKKLKIPLLKRCRKHRRHVQQKQPDAHLLKPTGKRLHTHLWLTKRMVMKPLYGYILPIRSSYRSFKAIDTLYQRKKTLVHDVSYEKAISFQCSRNQLIEILSSITDPASDLMEAIQYTKWKPDYCKEFHAIFHNLNEFPLGMIGPVLVTVKRIPSPPELSHIVLFQVWIWSHPLLHSKVETLLQQAITSLQSKDEEKITDASSSIVLQSRDDVCRMEFFGGNQLYTLAACILPYLFDLKQEKVYTDHAEYLSSLLTPKAIQTNVIDNVWRSGEALSLFIHDPRRRVLTSTKSSLPESSKASYSWLKNPAYLPQLWDFKDRSKDTTTASIDDPSCELPNTFELNQRLYQQRMTHWQDISTALALGSLLPTSSFTGNPALHLNASPSNANTNTVHSFPCLMIYHHPIATTLLTDQTLPSFSFIIPATAARIFWQHCLLNKGRVIPIGLEEKQYLQQQHGVLTFPRDYLDCPDGLQYWKDRQEDTLKKQKTLSPHLIQTDRNKFHILKTLQQLLPMHNTDKKEERKENTMHVEEDHTVGDDNEEMELSFMIDNQGSAGTNDIIIDVVSVASSTVSVQQSAPLQPAETVQVMEEDKKDVEDTAFVIVRNQRHLQSLIPMAQATTTASSSWYKTLIANIKQSSSITTDLSPTSLPPLPNLSFTTFVHTFLQQLHRGLIRSEALIYLPTHADIDAYLLSLASRKEYLDKKKEEARKKDAKPVKQQKGAVTQNEHESSTALEKPVSKKELLRRKKAMALKILYDVDDEKEEEDADDGLGYISIKGHFASMKKTNDKGNVPDNNTVPSSSSSGSLLATTTILTSLKYGYREVPMWNGVYLGPQFHPSSTNTKNGSDEEDFLDNEENNTAGYEQQDNPRTLIGMITSGFPAHANNEHAYLPTPTATGCCSLPLLYEHMRQYHHYREYEQSGFFVLYRNPMSPWLRPAMISFAPTSHS